MNEGHVGAGSGDTLICESTNANHQLLDCDNDTTAIEVYVCQEPWGAKRVLVGDVLGVGWYYEVLTNAIIVFPSDFHRRWELLFLNSSFAGNYTA